jgi:hypothetical protein
MTMGKSKDYRSGRDAQSAPSQLSIEDTATVRARFERGKPGPSAFDPYAGALPARPPTAKKDLRKLGERMIIMMKRPFAWFRMMCANAKRAAEVGAAALCVAAFAVEAAISLVNLFA